jgi:hypothetical protein
VFIVIGGGGGGFGFVGKALSQVRSPVSTFEKAFKLTKKNHSHTHTHT